MVAGPRGMHYRPEFLVQRLASLDFLPLPRAPGGHVLAVVRAIGANVQVCSVRADAGRPIHSEKHRIRGCGMDSYVASRPCSLEWRFSAA